MKQFKSTSNIIILNCIIYLLGIIIFISGFLSVKRSLSGYSNNDDIPYFGGDNSQIETKMKIVFIVIDALRADFIPSIAKNSYDVTMPYLEELIVNGTALAFVSIAHSPTVTLPRITAMMSGTIPAFSDVILNLDATTSKDDSILYQAHRAKHKVIFYGDDTWVKLFQNYFHSYEGTTSFFVNDYTEVDYNVTRHLDKVTKQRDWDWLILHYLGLDHIGHLSGHSSPLIKPKLKEMDDVVRRLHHSLADENYMIIVTGDHGMTASGSHGGASISEVFTPLIFISKDEAKTKIIEHVGQVDIAPTLSVLMGLPIPKNSVGKIIPTVLEKVGATPEVIMKALFRNANQVANVLRVNGVFDNEADLKLLVREHKAWLQNPIDEAYHFLKTKYISLMKGMSVKLEHSLTGYDIYSMILGFLTVFATLLSVSRIASMRGMLLLQEEMFFMKLMLFVPSLIISCGIHFLVCIQTSHPFCTWVPYWPVPVALLTYFFYHIIQCSYLIPSALSEQGINFGIESFVIISAILHVVSFGSSSFVEEEHQTWYFFTTTLIILLFIGNVGNIIMSYDITLQIDMFKRKSQGNFCIYRRSLLVKMSYCFGFLVLARVSRSWNQTGNKWSHLPDIADYLREENAPLLVILTVVSLIVMLVLLRTNRTSQQCCLLLAILGTLGYHLESVNVSGVSPSRQIIALFVYLAIAVHVLENAWHVFMTRSYKHSRMKRCEVFLQGMSTSWMLLVLLLCRLHNVTLFLLIVLQEKLLQKLVWNEPVPFFVRTSAYLWTSMCAFFYQGNSNMISTLDVSAGYVGLSSYQPIIVTALMICNTYSGLVYFLLQYVVHLCRTSALQASMVDKTNITALLCIKLLSGTMYLAVLIHLRHHLFIWTVFAPKLLYEGAHSVVFTLFIFLILFVTKITGKA